MKTLMHWLLVPTVLVGVGSVVRAQEAGERGKSGKVLLLRTGFVLEGDIEQVGTQMCVRRGKSEVWIAADKSMRLCPDWVDAYAFMQTLINRDSAAERVKLARWCHMNQLNEEALTQARAALALEAGYADAKRIVTILERAAQAPPTRPVMAAPVPTPARVREPAPPTVDVTTETLISFTAKIQPILMNTCASCHAGEAGDAFHLERVAETGHKISTQRNLAAVLRYIDLDRPAISPLLVKAITPHGREPAPAIRDRSAKPFQALQQWIGDTIRKNPHLKDYQSIQKPARVTARPVEMPSAFSAQGIALPGGGSGDVISQSAPRLEAVDAKASPPSAVRERDPFDPQWYNEWAHPGARGQQQTARGGQR